MFSTQLHVTAVYLNIFVILLIYYLCSKIIEWATNHYVILLYTTIITILTIIYYCKPEIVTDITILNTRVNTDNLVNSK